jgi:hypothetical protein
MEQEPSSSGSTLKLLGAQMAGGAVLGFVGSSLLGPGTIALLYKPPSGDAFSCADTVKTALGQFVAMQLTCAAIGAVGLTLIVFLVRRALRNRRAQRNASPA